MLLGFTTLINAQILLVILEIADANVSNRHRHKRITSSVDLALHRFI